MSRDYLPIYNGALKANRIGSFVRDGVVIDIISPGYDAQGRRRKPWTQFVVDGVPIYEWKLQADLDVVMKKFDELWAEFIAGDLSFLHEALANCRHDHLNKFRDGTTGNSPAPSLTHDGRPDGKQYPA